MWRRFIILIGLVIAGVGIWAINHEHARNAFCNASTDQVVTSKVSSSCLDIATLYFLGFAILMVGLFMARRARKYNKADRRPDPEPGQRWDHPVVNSYQRPKKATTPEAASSTTALGGSRDVTVAASEESPLPSDVAGDPDPA